MRKSIFAYWSVLCHRFVDNLHHSILHSLLYNFAEKIVELVNEKYMPSDCEYSPRVKKLMDEPTEIANKRESLTKALDKINQCLKIVQQMSSLKSIQ